jgi:HEPN domain-containing protein
MRSNRPERYMNDKKITIANWLTKAEHDLTTAHLVFNHLPDYRDTVAFHCQQAVEKLLKAYLIHLSVVFRRSHDLIYLLDLIDQPDVFTIDDYDQLARLQDYAVEIRYPNDTIFLDQADVQDALAIADGVSVKINAILR